MYSQKFIKEVEMLVAKGNTRKAIKKLNQSNISKANPTLKKYLILLTAQWYHYQRDKLEDIKPDRALKKELNRINKAILFFLEGNFAALEPIGAKTKFSLKQKIFIGLIALLIFLATIFTYLFLKRNGF